MSRITESIRSCSPTLIPYLTAGYPNIQTTAACIRAAAEGGAAVIEIGIPHTDPIADGPVIQSSFTEALAQGISADAVFSTVKQLSEEIDVPLVAMVSYSIVYRFGPERYVRRCQESGFAGLIVPDLSLEEAAAMQQLTQSSGIDLIPLVAPTSPSQRQRRLASAATGFLYYLSVAGITGERDELPADLQSNVGTLRTMTKVPICVGFGIHTQRQVAAVNAAADGAVVGSAIVRRIGQNKAKSPEAIGSIVGDYVKELVG